MNDWERYYRYLLIIILYFASHLAGLNRTSGNFRIQGDLIGNIITASMIVLLLMPNNAILKRAVILGLFLFLFDGIEESIAYLMNWWKAELGSTYYPYIPVPIEMIGSFLFIGIAIAMVFSVPEIIRQIDFAPLNWLKPFFDSPEEDFIWVIATAIFMIIGGALADWNSIAAGVYIPSPGWGFINLVFVWGFNGVITVFVFYILKRIFGSGGDLLPNSTPVAQGGI